MKKHSVRFYRALSWVVIILIVGSFLFFCLTTEKPAALVSGESYAPIYGGADGESRVCLMFNVYENTEVVNGLLDVLGEYGVKATFFVGGCWTDDNPNTIKRILFEGHDLGNHGYFHKDHKKLNEKENELEIKTNHDVVFAMTGYQMTLFAPPSGSYSVTALKVAERLGYKTVMWTKDTIDWRDSDLKLVIKRATDVTGGEFILMHPKPHTLAALPQILDYYKEKGLTPALVKDLIK
ncbi:MAG: polysaccharide deacetylase family protein [Clostridia bacterium]|nr:polysaccharide deacetylase family protein [Clostridia bacterium]